jgi:hypothetical protein
MISESRMTARDSFAQQRAQILFARTPPVGEAKEASRRWNDKDANHATRQDIVRHGLIGFLSSGVK